MRVLTLRWLQLRSHAASVVHATCPLKVYRPSMDCIAVSASRMWDPAERGADAAMDPVGPEAAVEGGAGLSHGAKRPRRAADRPRERRGGIAREFRARHVRVVRLALDEIRRRGAELVDK